MLPWVKTEGGGRLDFTALSAGERTALYILTIAQLNRRFLKLGVLMIDEPFEHLDLANRTFLRDFLFQLCERKHVAQLVITTYEETLTRKFLTPGFEAVNIIRL